MELNIPLNLISPNPQQPRQVFNPDDIASLAQSMQESTQVLNITVEQDPINPECYIIIDGERRWRAAQLAGWLAIRATVLPASQNNGAGARSRLVMALVANLQRADLNPIEEANAYRQMLQMGMNNAEICRATGINPNRLASRLAWLELAPTIQQFVAAGQLPTDRRIADAIASLPDAHRLPFATGIAERPGLTISAILNAANRLAAKLAQEDTSTAASPAVRRVDGPQPSGYTALSAAGKLPPWERLRSETVRTCKACALFDVASAATCADCPLVTLLNHLTSL